MSTEVKINRKTKTDREVMFNVTREVVVGNVTHGGDQHPIAAAFAVIADDAAEGGVYEEAATYRFPGPEEGSTIRVNVGMEVDTRG